MRWTLILVLFLGGCTKWVPDDGYDAGMDTGVDTGVDATLDASVDASVDAAWDAAPDAALDAQVDAAPECTGNAQCANPEPICDATSLECRGCRSDDTCGDGHSDTPVCFDTRCVVCSDSAAHCSDLALPICDPGSHDCRGCDADPECAARDADLPVCFEAAGTCVVCDEDNTSQCVNPNPVCDLGLNDCRPCEAHVECPSGACDYATGECLDEASEVWYVDFDLCGSGDQSGSRTDPFCQVQPAITAATSDRRVILVAESATPYLRFSVTDKDVWVIGATRDVLFQDSTSLEPVVKVISNQGTQHSRLTLESATVENLISNAPGLRCTGTTSVNDSLTLWNVLVTNNAGGGLSASSCSLSIDRSNFSSNAGGGLSLSSTSFTIDNSFVTGNGGPSSNFGGLFISTAIAASTIRFSTIMDNEVGTGISDPAGVFCSGGPCGSITVNSSIVWGNEGTDLSTALGFSYSVIESGGTPGSSNVTGPPGVAGDYHLVNGSVCINAGDPGTALLSDFDGDPRILGGLPDIGADEHQ